MRGKGGRKWGEAEPCLRKCGPSWDQVFAEFEKLFCGQLLNRYCGSSDLGTPKDVRTAKYWL